MCNLSEVFEENVIEKERFNRITGMLRKGKTPEEIVDFCDDYTLEEVLSVQAKLSDSN